MYKYNVHSTLLMYLFQLVIAAAAEVQCTCTHGTVLMDGASAWGVLLGIVYCGYATKLQNGPFNIFFVAAPFALRCDWNCRAFSREVMRPQGSRANL